MKINIYAVDGMVYGVELENVKQYEVADRMMMFADEVQQKGYYVYNSPRSGRINIVPWHSITGVEQTELIHDNPYQEKERVVLE